MTRNGTGTGISSRCSCGGRHLALDRLEHDRRREHDRSNPLLRLVGSYTTSADGTFLVGVAWAASGLVLPIQTPGQA